MINHVVVAAIVIVAICVLVRLADIVLEPALPMVVIAVFLAGVAWVILGRPRDLS